MSNIIFSRNQNQKGISHVMLVLAVLVIAAIVLIGYRVAGNHNEKFSYSSATKTAAVPKTISSTKDLEQTQSALNAVNLDNDLNPTQLDSDVNSLL